MMISLRAMAAI